MLVKLAHIILSPTIGSGPENVPAECCKDEADKGQ
jgi:hypothetical protein